MLASSSASMRVSNSVCMDGGSWVPWSIAVWNWSMSSRSRFCCAWLKRSSGRKRCRMIRVSPVAVLVLSSSASKVSSACPGVCPVAWWLPQVAR